MTLTDLPADATEHERAAYATYRARLAWDRVTPEAPELWLANYRRDRLGFWTVYHANGGMLAPGWYVNRFGPDRRLLERLGPFASEADANRAAIAPGARLRARIRGRGDRVFVMDVLGCGAGGFVSTMPESGSWPRTAGFDEVHDLERLS